MADLNAELERRMQSFIKGVTDAARRVAIDALKSGIGNGAEATTPAMRPRRIAPASKPPPRADELAPKILAHVTQNPGLRMEQLRDGLRLPTEQIQGTIKTLVTDGQVRFEGVARGRRYFPGTTATAPRRARAGKTSRKKVRRKASA